MIRVLIVDDETPARTELRFLLNSFRDVEVVAEAPDGETALRMCSEIEPDLAFLDIQMPVMSGVEVAEALLCRENSPYIIFITAFDSYAINAFELHAIDYLLKPVETVRLENSLERVRKLMSSDGLLVSSSVISEMKKMISDFRISGRLRYITVCKDEKYRPVPIETIKYICADKKKTYLVTEEGKFPYKGSLGSLEKILPENFIRTHKSYIVNVRFIKDIEPWFNGAYRIAIHREEISLPLSRVHSKSFREIMHMD